jgi:16S rRNA (guanine527-N7)-methyltransferase
MELIHKYFPDLTDRQIEQFSQLKELYQFWNEQINVISRKDMDQFYERHVLHSLAISKIIQFKDTTSFLDVGTGGGFPGIPLAILYPNCTFHLVDSIGKKIKVVKEVANSLGLDNVKATHTRAENIKEKYDFVISRAVTAMPAFLQWVNNKIKKKQINALPNGILYLKGGDLTEEMAPVKNYYEINPISSFFEEEFFETKKVVYVQLN